MTQQFKFGDIVRDASLGVCVVINTSEHFAYIMNSRGNYNTLANPADLEIIPHPDTERIDWLAKNDCALTEMLCDDDGERLDTPFAVIQKQEEHFKVLAAANNIRQAIDAAMQEQAEEAEAT